MLTASGKDQAAGDEWYACQSDALGVDIECFTSSFRMTRPRDISWKFSVVHQAIVKNDFAKILLMHACMHVDENRLIFKDRANILAGWRIRLLSKQIRDVPSSAIEEVCHLPIVAQTSPPFQDKDLYPFSRLDTSFSINVYEGS